jgi:hypothetical protein
VKAKHNEIKFSQIGADDRIRSKCGRFVIRRFPDWYVNGRAVWELRDDGEGVDTFDRLRDAKEFAQAIIEENGGAA